MSIKNSVTFNITSTSGDEDLAERDSLAQRFRDMADAIDLWIPGSFPARDELGPDTFLTRTTEHD